MTAYAPLLNVTEDQVRAHLDPADAMRLVARLRRVSFFIRSNVDLVTRFDEDGKPRSGYLGMGGNIPVSARVVTDMLRDMDHFNQRKAERGDDTGKVEVCRLGSCIFIG